jgi:hypothetical protein
MGQVMALEHVRLVAVLDNTSPRKHTARLQGSSVQMTQRDVDEICAACDHVCTCLLLLSWEVGASGVFAQNLH